MLKLVKPDESHVVEMMSWFKNERELKQWSGPNFRYPFDKQSFIEDINLNGLSSFFLINEEGFLLAFGQYYIRFEKCHLGRLVVAPKERGNGYAKVLMDLLCKNGKTELNMNNYSLFVMSDNTNAIKAYQSYGFEFNDYPEQIPLENCLYMTKTG